MSAVRYIAIAAIVCAPNVAHSWPLHAADDPTDAQATPPAPAPETSPATDEPEPPPSPAELADRIEELERKQKELERESRRGESTREQVKTLLPLGRFITVFVDVGAFSVAGDGSGIRSDLGHYYFPQYAGHVAGQWVFMGDPLSTAINSLGEPADTSNSREIHTDTIQSKGQPSFLVNAIGLTIAKEVGHDFSVSALAELLPRPGPDILDIELAQINYRPSHEIDFEISAGKIDSVLGVEYRSQDAPRRLGISPSLICRYTCGRPVGVQARLVRGRLSTSASLTNGDNFDERFEPHLQLKLNKVPTVAGHVQWKVWPSGGGEFSGDGLVVGVSGAIGPQDNQPDSGVAQWHVGADVQLTAFHQFDVTAELVQGSQDGSPMSGITCGGAPCLTYKGGYVLVDHKVNSRLTPYVRVDFRNAIHLKGADFVYESHTLRSTIGAHFAMTSRIIAKLEYTFNRETGGIPQFNNDILTSSLVVATD
jgi:hypothetical protein